MEITFEDYLKSERPTLDWKVVPEQVGVREALVMALRAEEPRYVEQFPKVITHLAYYIKRDSRFEGDLNKGIILSGNTGSGKTLLMSAFQKVMRYVHKFGYKTYTGKQMEHIYRKEGVRLEELEKALDYQCFGFDDIGEEHDHVMVYGSKINVGIDVLTHRHLQVKKGFLTFGTTNLNKEKFDTKYGDRLKSRRHEMFSWITMTGKDNRI